MSDSIISGIVNTPLHKPLNNTVTGQGINPVATGGLLRAERTPGAVAVSASTQKGGRLNGLSPDAIEATWRLGFRSYHHRKALSFVAEKDHLEDLLGRPLVKPQDHIPWPEKIVSKSYYNDFLAKRLLWDKDRVKFVDEVIKTKCPGYFIHGFDDEGYSFAKELYCGREWCPICGEKGSVSHNRRVSRLMWRRDKKNKALISPRITQMETIGYFVIEWPLASRSKLRSKQGLRDAGIKLRKVLKRWGYLRGVTRWHWFGEKGDIWNPHLNILVDGKYLPDAVLGALKAKLRSAMGEPDLIINYSYRQTPAEMYHTVKYVTRATFLKAEWDIEMALKLKGFRNQSWWGAGKWEGEILWGEREQNEDADLKGGLMDSKKVNCLEQGISPYTGRPITWGKVLPINILHGGNITIDTGVSKVTLKIPGLKKRGLGNGYFELERVTPPKGHTLDKNQFSAEMHQQTQGGGEGCMP